MRRLSLPWVLACALVSPVTLAPVFAQPAQPLTMADIMADPDWIGPPVESTWWSWDGQRAYFTLKREGETIRDTWVQPIAGGAATRLDDAARADLDAQNPIFDATRTRMAFVRNGDLFVRDLRTGTLTQITRTEGPEAQPQWTPNGGLIFSSFSRSISSSLSCGMS